MELSQEEIYSKVLRAGRRTYFFDVRETKAERLLPYNHRKQKVYQRRWYLLLQETQNISIQRRLY